jgi:DNA-binding response OmpR family regulator
LKTRSDRNRTINLVGCDIVLCERIRASLRRGPFHFIRTEEALPVDQTDLCIAPAAAARELAGKGVPVIAFGPPALLRAAFLDGCADYLKDPWTPEELAMRALAALAREEPRLSFPGGALCLEGRRIDSERGPVALTLHECRILRLLLAAHGEPVPRDALAAAAGGASVRVGGRGGASRAVDAHVSALRRKLRRAAPDSDRATGPRIECVRGQGYLLR